MPAPPTPDPSPNPLSSGEQDRLCDRRIDAEWVRERLRDPSTRFAAVSGLHNLVLRAGRPAALLLPLDILEEELISLADPILLCEEGGAAVFAVDVATPAAAERLPGEFVELRSVAADLPRREAALLAHARAMVYWHSRHRHCGVCGARTVARDAGHIRVCSGSECGAEHFPRTDPAIIVLVTRGERCLLGRQAAWVAGRYATLAGFVEPGESLEDAVAREVLEEVGVRVTGIRYHSSQPWPFPASLMLGFTATAEAGEIRVDPSELEDARWFSRQELRDGVSSGNLSLPSPVSVAHALIRDWLGPAG